jgi:cell division transport system permease protein
MKSAKTTWKHIRRNPYQSLAAILITAITFFTISFFAFIILSSSIVISHLESQLEVVAFFQDEAKQSDITALQDTLRQTGQIKEMKFVSKKEALDKYRQMHQNDPILLELVTEDILPASLEISTVNTTDLPAIAEKLKNSTLVSEVKYPQDVVEKFSQWTNAINMIGIGLIAVLAAESVLIIMSIVGFKISQKKEEIEIMKLLSATNWYIRKPFILEGIIYGIIGTILGWGLAVAGLSFAPPVIKLFLESLNVTTTSISTMFFLQLLAGELIIAIIIGMFASSIAVLRYLK